MSRRSTQKKLEDYVRSIFLSKDLKSHETWSRAELHEFQYRQLNSLVRHAVQRSSFYKKLYRSVNTDNPVSLEMLPIVSKKMLMDNFDTVVTDPMLHSSELYQYLDLYTPRDYYIGEYRILSTAGSSGLRGVFMYDRAAWGVVLASMQRAFSWMGLSSLRDRRLASIGASSPLHLSYRRAVDMDIGLYRFLRLEATSRINTLVRELNEFQPEYIHMYPTIAYLLAREQTEGRLKISPHTIVTGAELLTQETSECIQEAWRIVPFNCYSSTEGIVAFECVQHNGMHLFEDLCIVEVVDEHNRPVPDGCPGYKYLLTNLYQYVQPLIRYEVMDMITLSSEVCACGLPFKRIEFIEGRSDDIILLEGLDGKSVPVHSIHFHSPIASIAEVIHYEVVHRRNGLHIALAVAGGTGKRAVETLLVKKLQTKFRDLRIKPPPIHINFIMSGDVPPNPTGKMKLVREEV